MTRYVKRFEIEANLLASIEDTSKAILATMGPYGNNIMIMQEHGLATSTKDGVTVARSQGWESPLDQLASALVQDAAYKTEQKAGDGTTTSCALIAGMVSAIDWEMENKYQTATYLKKRVSEMCEGIKKMSKKIKTEKELINIARVACNYDEELAQVIGKSVFKVGSIGTIQVLFGDQTKHEYKKGYSFRPGVVSPLFLRGEKELVLKKAKVFLCVNPIESLNEIVKLMEICKGTTGILICDDIKGAALSSLATNYQQGNTNLIAVNAPQSGERRRMVFKDINAIVGKGEIWDEKLGKHIGDITPFDVVGTADIRVKADSTIIVGDGDIKGRLKEISGFLSDDANKEKLENNQDLKNFYEDRHTGLVSGTATIVIKSTSMVERGDKGRLADDAILACQAALKEGYLTGGATTFFHLSTIEDNIILKRGLEAPICTVYGNRGYGSEIILTAARTLKEDEYLDEFLAPKHTDSIIEPVLVLTTALENAVSVVGEILTSKYLLFRRNE